MLENQAMDALDLDATETHAALKSNRLEPELGELILMFHVDVRRLLAIAPRRKRTDTDPGAAPSASDDDGPSREPLQPPLSRRREVSVCGPTCLPPDCVAPVLPPRRHHALAPSLLASELASRLISLAVDLPRLQDGTQIREPSAGASGP